MKAMDMKPYFKAADNQIICIFTTSYTIMSFTSTLLWFCFIIIFTQYCQEWARLKVECLLGAIECVNKLWDGNGRFVS